MATCNSCGTTILFGGKTDANGRFCGARCQQRGALLALAKQIPDATVREQVWKTHQGVCPKCGGSGPIDVCTSHRVWSALVLTKWSSIQQLSCRPCGRKSQWSSLGFSFLLGWWGFPWGLVMTPIQVGRNVVGLGRSAHASTPSPELYKFVRIAIAKPSMNQASTSPPLKA